MTSSPSGWPPANTTRARTRGVGWTAGSLTVVVAVALVGGITAAPAAAEQAGAATSGMGS